MSIDFKTSEILLLMDNITSMSKLLKDRLEALMIERGYNMKSLSLAADLSETYVRAILRRNTKPSVQNLAKIAKELNCTPAYLMGEDKPFKPTIPIIGKASAGEGWMPYDTLDDQLDVDFSDKSLISIVVEGDSMHPIYRDGDYLIADRVDGANIHNIVGRDCIIYTADGESYIKILNKGSSPTTYNLRSYNPTYPDIEDVKIKWAAPVVWIKRNNF